MSTNTSNAPNVPNVPNPSNPSNNEKKTSIIIYIILLLFSFLFLSIGIFTIKKYNKYNTGTKAKVIDNDCKNIRTTNDISYKCNIKLEYYVKETQSNRTQIIQTSNVIYSVGESVSIRYNSSDSSQIILESDSNKLTGFIFAAIGGFILVILFLILIGVISPIQVSNSTTVYPSNSYQIYQTPEQRFASSFGMAMGSKIANRI